MPKLVVAYSDESGNTGLNLFDDRQAWFWTGTLLVRKDLQAAGLLLKEWAQAAGVDELHANVLGFDRIERIADRIRLFLAKQMCWFVFTRIEKRHLAGTKFVDAVLDPGLNDAVHWLHYGAKPLRLPLAHVLVEHMTARDQEEFWAAYHRTDADLFRGVVQRVALRVQKTVADARTRKLLGDSLSWAAAHPEKILAETGSHFDSPNVTALTMLLDTAHRALRGTGLRIGRFVHDEQKQFAQALKKMYEIGSRFTDSSHDPLSFMAALQKISTYRCDIELVPSRDVVGLKIIDIALWLLKRTWEPTASAEGYPACRRLADFISRAGTIRSLSRDQLTEDALECLNALDQIDLSPEDGASSRATFDYSVWLGSRHFSDRVSLSLKEPFSTLWHRRIIDHGRGSSSLLLSVHQAKAEPYPSTLGERRQESKLRNQVSRSC